jgi:hypothetical protein
MATFYQQVQVRLHPWIFKIKEMKFIHCVRTLPHE